MDRQSLTFAVVLVASITVGAIPISSQQDGVRLSAVVNQQANSNQREEDQNAAQGSTKHVEAIDSFVGLSANAWVALFTVVLTCVAALQALIYFLQLRTTHRTERAYVYIDGISHLENFGPGLAPTIQFDVKNSGRTPARILASNAAFLIPPRENGFHRSFRKRNSLCEKQIFG